MSAATGLGLAPAAAMAGTGITDLAGRTGEGGSVRNAAASLRRTLDDAYGPYVITSGGTIHGWYRRQVEACTLTMETAGRPKRRSPGGAATASRSWGRA